MGIVALSMIYWIAVAIIFLVGLVMLIVKSSKNLPLKPALRLMIIAVILLVIGVGACAIILGNLNLGGMH
jgi:hypothetical protein